MPGHARRSSRRPSAAPGHRQPGPLLGAGVLTSARSGRTASPIRSPRISAIPAATGAVRDMTGVRLEVPEFIAEKCTGCAQCWMQCPDAAIPGLVNSVEEVLDAAIATAANGTRLDRLRQVAQARWRKEAQRLLDAARRSRRSATRSTAAYATVAGKLGWDAERRAATRRASSPRCAAAVAEFPLAQTTPFFDVPEAKREGHAAACSRSRSTPRPARAATSAWRCAPTARSSPSSRTTRSSDGCAATGSSGSKLPDTRRPLRQRLATSTKASASCSSLLLKKDDLPLDGRRRRRLHGLRREDRGPPDRLGRSTRSMRPRVAQARRAARRPDRGARREGARAPRRRRRPRRRAAAARRRSPCRSTPAKQARRRAPRTRRSHELKDLALALRRGAERQGPRVDWAWRTAPAARRCGAAPIRTIRTRSRG